MATSVRAAAVFFEPRWKRAARALARELARRFVVGTRMNARQLFALPTQLLPTEATVPGPPPTGMRTIAIVAAVAMLHVGVLFASALAPKDTSNAPHIV